MKEKVSIEDKDKVELECFKEKIIITKSNYINMKKRFIENNDFINIILIYYSLFLIVSSVTSKFFSSYNSILDSYFNIIISIVLLVLSLLNGNLKYRERAQEIRESILKLNELEKELNGKEIDIEEKEKKYHEIIKVVEVRGDQDYYKTAIEIKGIKTQKYKDEISCAIANSSLPCNSWNIIVKITRGIIYILPFIIMGLCFSIKENRKVNNINESTQIIILKRNLI